MRTYVDRFHIGAGSSVGAHCVLEGSTRIGRDNRIFAHAAVGGAPQDMKYRGEPTALEIGDRNTIREFCTFNRGTAQDGGAVGHGEFGGDRLVVGHRLPLLPERLWQMQGSRAIGRMGWGGGEAALPHGMRPVPAMGRAVRRGYPVRMMSAPVP